MRTLGHGMVGKQVKGNRYFHVAALEELEPHLYECVQFAAAQADLHAEDDYNVVKIDEADDRISLLYVEVSIG